jgi:hypothetical protein
MDERVATTELVARGPGPPHQVNPFDSKTLVVDVVHSPFTRAGRSPCSFCRQTSFIPVRTLAFLSSRL